MLDRRVRAVLARPLDAAGARAAAAGIAPNTLTAIGWVVGVGACVAAGFGGAWSGAWWLALVLWLANRLFDGLDGPLARHVGATERGGFLDIVADFSIYGGFVIGVAVAVPDARLACVVLLAAYYCSGTAFLALSSLLEKQGRAEADERSLRFVGGLAEGTETVIAYVLFCLLPAHAGVIAWVFAAMVAVTALQRVISAMVLLSPGRADVSEPSPVSQGGTSSGARTL